jgi:hypothetical protein
MERAFFKFAKMRSRTCAGGVGESERILTIRASASQELAGNFQRWFTVYEVCLAARCLLEGFFVVIGWLNFEVDGCDGDAI